ncbi:MAG: hypothetical protein PQJ46_10850 [Spirochaetales bacterium]|nr:hypothetical protein [Spirochaetales bacterium]
MKSRIFICVLGMMIILIGAPVFSSETGDSVNFVKDSTWAKAEQAVNAKIHKLLPEIDNYGENVKLSVEKTDKDYYNIYHWTVTCLEDNEDLSTSSDKAVGCKYFGDVALDTEGQILSIEYKGRKEFSE